MVIGNPDSYYLFRNVESLGFSSVQISSYQEQGNSLYNVSLTLPDLDISGIYSAVGSHHYFYPIVGYGPFALTLRKVWSTGTTTLLFDGKDVFYIQYYIPIL